jgi:hypothetical protein
VLLEQGLIVDADAERQVDAEIDAIVTSGVVDIEPAEEEGEPPAPQAVTPVVDGEGDDDA